MPKETNYSINSIAAGRQSPITKPIPISLNTENYRSVQSPVKSSSAEEISETVASPTKTKVSQIVKIRSGRELRVKLVRLKFPKVEVTEKELANDSNFITTSTTMTTAVSEGGGTTSNNTSKDVVEVVDITDDVDEQAPLKETSEEILVSVSADTILAMEQDEVDAFQTLNDVNLFNNVDTTTLKTSSTMAGLKKYARRKSLENSNFSASLPAQTCVVCNQRFGKNTDYLAHVRQHLRFKCRHCVKEFATYAKLKNHCLRVLRTGTAWITGRASSPTKATTTEALAVGPQHQVPPPASTWTSMQEGIPLPPRYDAINTENNNSYPLHFMNTFFDTDNQLKKTKDIPVPYAESFNGYELPSPPFNFNVPTSTIRQTPSPPDSTPAQILGELEYMSYKDLLTPLSKIKKFAMDQADGTLLFTVHELEKHAMTKIITASLQ